MAKVSSVLKELNKSIQKFDDVFAFYSMKTDENRIREFISLFDSIDDTRMKNKCTYSTVTVVGIVFLGVLNNLDTWSEISYFCEMKQDYIGRFVDLSNGIPSHDTLQRVFSLINSETLENTLVSFIQKSIQKTAELLKISNSNRILAIDGKELKGSGRKYNTDEKIKNAQIMHFYDASTGVCIKSELIEEKTNEIPTAQTVLAALNIKNVIVTSDAMNCQKQTAEIIRKGRGHYVLGLKGNHSDFYHEVKEKFKTRPRKTKTNYYKMETEKNHNQVEVRRFYKIAAKDIYGSEEWKDIKSIVLYEKTVTNNFTGEEKSEERYYISDCSNIELIATAVRRHWSVENELHWHMDANFHEDANRTTERKAANNLSIIKKNVLTLLKLIQPVFGKMSLRITRKAMSWDYEKHTMMLFALLDSKNIKELIRQNTKPEKKTSE